METILAELRSQLDAEREARGGKGRCRSERQAVELRAGDLRDSLEQACVNLRGQQVQAVTLQAEAGEVRQAAATAREAANLGGQVQRSGRRQQCRQR